MIAVLRKTGLLPAAEEIRFWSSAVGNFSKNRSFAASHPTVAFPPSRISYDAYGGLAYEDYYAGGIQSAETILALIKGDIDFSRAKILEWGCGPGRIVRQLEFLLRESGSTIFGCDYNPASIRWCSSAIPRVTFALNGLRPPLPYESGFFDVVYSSSVFTHLSEEMHYAWLKENLRVLKSRGLLLFTTQGDRMKHKLLPAEVQSYEMGEIVVRGSKIEGARTFTAFQSPAFVRRRLLASTPGLELIRHETELFLAGIQDIWVARKS